MTYTEAVNLLAKSGKCPELKHGNDFNANAERKLMECVNYIPVFVTHFPANIKPFYMKQENNSVSRRTRK